MLRLCAAVCLLGLLSAGARGAVNVGDKPTWNFDSSGPDAKHIDLADYHGHFVVIDFWNSNISKQQFQIILNADRQYGAQGVAFLGVNLDDNKQHMLTTMTDKGINWPQFCDEQQLASPMVGVWGVKTVPYDVLIGPDGAVLWHGPSRLLASTLDDAMHSIATAPDPQMVTTALDAVDKALADGDLAAAARQWNTIPASAALDDKLAPRVSAMPKTLEEAAEKRLGEIDTLIDQKQYAQAKTLLHEIVTLLPKFAAAPKARERLTKLLKLGGSATASTPTAKPATNSTAHSTGPRTVPQPPQNATAEDALAAALKLKYEGKDLEAYARFKTVARNFAGTPSGDRAAEEVAAYERNPEFMKTVGGKQ